DAQVGHNDSGGYVVGLSDVTEDQVANQERIERGSNSSIMRLAAGGAHEVGNPLNSLTTHLPLIERKLKKMRFGAAGEHLSESLAVCQGEVQRLDGIITHFLEAIRPQKPEFNEIDLVATVDEVLQVQEAELGDRRLDVSVDVNQTIPHILGDRGLI